MGLDGQVRPGIFVVPDTLATAEGLSAHRNAPRQARRYLQGYLRGIRLLDLLAVVVALVVAHATHVGRAGLQDVLPLTSSGVGLDHLLIPVVLGLGWMLALHLQKAYDGRLVGHGVQEYRLVFHASMWLFAVLAIVAFALDLGFLRGYVLVAFPLGTLLLLVGRCAVRRWLVQQRRQGRLADRVLLVGDPEHIACLAVALRRAPDAGYNVVGACVDRAPAGQVSGVPVLGPESDVLLLALEQDVDVVAVSSATGLGENGLRRLGWALEGTDIDLVVAPGIMDVAGPRVLTRPVQGLPLIHVEAPTFAGPQLVLKNVMDRLGGLLALLVFGPLLLAVALAVKLEDGGPVLFRQERVGRDGEAFTMFKFRSMCLDAEARLPELLAANEGAGPLFKLRDDPRVTRTGALIRRFSLDELPQILNVVRGEMSLTGPRPPLPREVAEYEHDTRRRLLVKPGMTGLWQINGRSDLSWEEAVRLDLYYVENWTPVLDLMIMWRTVRVVLRPGQAGAY